jgi:hypothetical protein
LAAQLGLESVEELEAALDAMEGIADDGAELVPDNLSREARVRSAYLDWCKTYGKETDEERYLSFSSNYLAMETYAKESGKEMTLNEYADYTEEEYMKLSQGSSDEEDAAKAKAAEEEAAAAEEAKVAAAAAEEAKAAAAAKEAEAAKKAKEEIKPKKVEPVGTLRNLELLFCFSILVLEQFSFLFVCGLTKTNLTVVWKIIHHGCLLTFVG